MMEVNLLVAFVSGLVSFFAPCIVPMIPAYVSYICGVSLKRLVDGTGDYKKKVLVASLFYVLGFSLVFTVLGTLAAGLGGFLRQQSRWIEMVGGGLIVLFGLEFGGWLNLPFAAEGHRLKLPGWTSRLGYGKAFLLGVVFATAWTPCVGPVLGVILTLAASSQTMWEGAVLLLVYSLGISVPFLVVSLSLAQSQGLMRKITKYLVWVQKVFGLVLVVIGLLLLNNSLGWVSESLTYDGLNRWLFEVAGRLRWR